MFYINQSTLLFVIPLPVEHPGVAHLGVLLAVQFELVFRKNMRESCKSVKWYEWETVASLVFLFSSAPLYDLERWAFPLSGEERNVFLRQ